MRDVNHIRMISMKGTEYRCKGRPKKVGVDIEVLYTELKAKWKRKHGDPTLPGYGKKKMKNNNCIMM